MQTVEEAEGMTDYQFRALMEMFKGIVRELKDPDKIIERIERIQKGEFEEKGEFEKLSPKTEKDTRC